MRTALKRGDAPPGVRGLSHSQGLKETRAFLSERFLHGGNVQRKSEHHPRELGGQWPGISTEARGTQTKPARDGRRTIHVQLRAPEGPGWETEAWELRAGHEAAG